MTVNVPGQIDLLDTLHQTGDNKQRNTIRAAGGDPDRQMVPLPEGTVEWFREHSGDWWFGCDQCIGCGQIERRMSLALGHGVQFDDAGGQHLPSGPRMAEEGVCMLMNQTAMEAHIARVIAAEHPRFAGWRTRCHQHDTPTSKKKCPVSHFAEDAEYKARVATRVWGSEAWKERAWK